MTYQSAASGFGAANFACSFACSRNAYSTAARTTRYSTQNPTAINTTVSARDVNQSMLYPLTHTIAGTR